MPAAATASRVLAPVPCLLGARWAHALSGGAPANLVYVMPALPPPTPSVGLVPPADDRTVT